MTRTFARFALLALTVCTVTVTAACKAPPEAQLGAPPPGFSSANAQELHYVRGGQGPAVILLHGFPEDWTEYRSILPRLAQRFTIVAIDLPGIGKSAPAAGGYDAASLAAQIHALAQALKLEQQWLVGHDLGGLVTYAYVRRFADSVRGAMILDVPMPGVDGWDEAVSGYWRMGFIRAPGGLAEKLVVGRPADFLGHFLDIAKFTPAQRAYYVKAYAAAQLHAAFEIYRAFPKDAAFNAAQTASNPTPLVVAVGEKSFFRRLVTQVRRGLPRQGHQPRRQGAHSRRIPLRAGRQSRRRRGSRRASRRGREMTHTKLRGLTPQGEEKNNAKYSSQKRRAHWRPR